MRPIPVDGLRWVVTDGSVVIQALPDGRLDRWTLDLPVRRMRLLEEGAVEVMTEVGGPRRLLRPGAAPIPAPFLADPEDLRVADGAGFPLLFGDLSSVHAVYAAMGPAQVFEGASLRALGPPIPGWFDEAALSPDGKLLVGISEGKVRAIEVASGRERWTARAPGREARIEIFPSFVSIEPASNEEEDGRYLYEAETGAPLWTLRSVDRRSSRTDDRSAIRIESSDGAWRSDALGGPSPLPRWAVATPTFALPPLGEPLVERMGAPVLAERVAERGPLRALRPHIEAELCANGYAGQDLRVLSWLGVRCPGRARTVEPWTAATPGGAPPSRPTGRAGAVSLFVHPSPANTRFVTALTRES